MKSFVIRVCSFNNQCNPLSYYQTFTALHRGWEGGVNGHIYSAAFRIRYSYFGTRISVERRVKFRYSSEICNNGGKISGFTRDRDPSFTRAPMLTGAPNKGRGRSA